MASTSSSFTLAAAGDAILNQRLSVHETDEFWRWVDAVQSADAAFVNLETLLHDYDGYPSAHGGYLYMRSPPWVADELDWAGFDLFGVAHNHAGDYSHGGMMATMKALETRGIAYAGMGRTLGNARSPAFVDTPNGRVALVAASSTLLPENEAGERRPDLQGRPGVSPLRLRTRHVLPDELYEQLRTISDSLGLEAEKTRRQEIGLPPSFDEGDDRFHFLNVDGTGHAGNTICFERGPEADLQRAAEETDAEAILDQVRLADRQADWVVTSLHAHEGDGPGYNDFSVAPFMERFARRCVDAGADAFVGHGPHVVRGIEIYDGAPLFYSLGDFAMQHDTITRFPQNVYDAYGLDHTATPADLAEAGMFDKLATERTFWESLLPVCEFDADGVASIDLYPLDLGFDRVDGRPGYPEVAGGETGDRILETVADLSADYGTDVVVDGDVGVIEP